MSLINSNDEWSVATPAERFAADVEQGILADSRATMQAVAQRDAERSAGATARLRRDLQVAWNALREEASERECLEAIAYEMFELAKESGAFNKQERFAKAAVVAYAAEMIGGE